MLPRRNTSFSPATRQSEPLLTTQLGSNCPLCNTRHTAMTNRSYLVHYAALPFKCEHGERIEEMRVVEPEDRVDPLINLPSTIFRIEPDCMSESSNGIVTPE